MTIYTALNRFRNGALRCDLAPDKQYILKGSVIQYVSIGKIRRVLAPLFVSAGLEFLVDTPEVTDQGGTLRVEVRFTLVDAANGDSLERTVIQYAPATDKGVEIAVSYAMRVFLVNTFMLSDGIDYESGFPTEPPVVAPVTRKVEETPSGASCDTEHPEEVSVTTGRIPVVQKRCDKEKEDEKPAFATIHLKAPADKGTVKTPEEETPAADPAPSSLVKPANPPSRLELAAARKAISEITEAYRRGEIVEESYQRAQELFKSVEDGTADSQTTFTLIKLKREMEDARPRKEGGM